MPIVTLEAAREHLRVEPDYPAEQIQPYINTAQAAAEQHLRRALFATPAEVDAAIALAPSKLLAAAAQRDEALTAADAMPSQEVAALLKAAAHQRYADAVEACQLTLAATAVTPEVMNAVLLLLTHFFNNRSETTADKALAEIPQGAKSLLNWSRTGWGV